MWTFCFEALKTSKLKTLHTNWWVVLGNENKGDLSFNVRQKNIYMRNDKFKVRGVISRQNIKDKSPFVHDFQNINE